MMLYNLCKLVIPQYNVKSGLKCLSAWLPRSSHRSSWVWSRFNNPHQGHLFVYLALSRAYFDNCQSWSDLHHSATMIARTNA